MNKFVPCLVLSLSLMGSARSQDPRTDRLFSQAAAADYISREFLMQQLEAGSAETAFAAAQRREAGFRERQFIEKVRHFVAKWDQFANEYNLKGGFNVKAARAMSKAFHELESSEGWPKDK
jgi:hypothetical protein